MKLKILLTFGSYGGNCRTKVFRTSIPTEVLFFITPKMGRRGFVIFRRLFRYPQYPAFSPCSGNYRSTASAIGGGGRLRLRLRARRGQRIVAFFGGYGQIGPVHAYLDGTVGAGSRSFGVVAKRVLVASDGRDLGVGKLDRLSVEFGKGISTGGDGVLGKDVRISEAGHAQPAELVINGDRGGVHTHGID